jgi:hypothetical protein
MELVEGLKKENETRGPSREADALPVFSKVHARPACASLEGGKTVVHLKKTFNLC